MSDSRSEFKDYVSLQSDYHTIYDLAKNNKAHNLEIFLQNACVNASYGPMTAVGKLAAENNIKATLLLVDDCGANVESAYVGAVLSESKELCQELEKRKPNILNSQVYLSAKLDDKFRTLDLINKGANVNMAITTALLNGNFGLLNFLISNGTSPNDVLSSTAQISEISKHFPQAKLAMQNEYVDFAKELISHGTRIVNAIAGAAQVGDLDQVNLWLEFAKKIGLQSNEIKQLNREALFGIVKSGEFSKIEEVSKNYFSLDMVIEGAAAGGHFKFIKCFNLTDRSIENSIALALTTAILGKHDLLANFLFPLVRNFIYAVQGAGRIKSIEWMKKIRPHFRDCFNVAMFGYLPKCTIKFTEEPFFKYLNDNGILYNSLLQAAVWNGRFDLIKQIIDLGASLDKLGKPDFYKNYEGESLIDIYFGREENAIYSLINVKDLSIKNKLLKLSKLNIPKTLSKLNVIESIMQSYNFTIHQAMSFNFVNEHYKVLDKLNILPSALVSITISYLAAVNTCDVEKICNKVKENNAIRFEEPASKSTHNFSLWQPFHGDEPEIIKEEVELVDLRLRA